MRGEIWPHGLGGTSIKVFPNPVGKCYLIHPTQPQAKDPCKVYCVGFRGQLRAPVIHRGRSHVHPRWVHWCKCLNSWFMVSLNVFRPPTPQGCSAFSEPDKHHATLTPESTWETWRQSEQSLVRDILCIITKVDPRSDSVQTRWPEPAESGSTGAK